MRQVTNWLCPRCGEVTSEGHAKISDCSKALKRAKAEKEVAKAAGPSNADADETT